MNNWTIIGIIISSVSVFIAIFQTWRQHKLNKFIKSEAMELYVDSGILLGNIQYALNDLSQNNVNAASINSAKAEGLCQAIFCRSVKNIYDQNKFSKIDVDKWADEGKIDAHHKSTFLKFTEK